MLDTEKTNASEMAELTAKFDKILACLSDEDYEAYPKKRTSSGLNGKDQPLLLNKKLKVNGQA